MDAASSLASRHLMCLRLIESSQHQAREYVDAATEV